LRIFVAPFVRRIGTHSTIKNRNIKRNNSLFGSNLRNFQESFRTLGDLGRMLAEITQSLVDQSPLFGPIVTGSVGIDVFANYAEGFIERGRVQNPVAHLGNVVVASGLSQRR
jgi:hypothetical protein